MNRVKPENIFVVLACIFSFLFMLVNPPFNAPDENDHFCKIYGFSQGVFTFSKVYRSDGKWYSGGEIPVNLHKIIKRYMGIRINNEKIKLSEFSAMYRLPLEKTLTDIVIFPNPSYNIFCYILFFPLFLLLKAFSVAPLKMMYILRFCNLLAYLAMIYWAIKLTPIKKWAFLASAGLPLSLYLASALNLDVLVIGLIFIFTAFIFNLAYNEGIKKITVKHLWIFSLLLIAITNCKFTYAVLILLFFIIPKEKLVGIAWRKFVGITFLICALMILSKGIFSLWNGQGGASFFAFQAPSDVIKYSLTNPLAFPVRLLNSIILLGGMYIYSTIAVFSWGTVFSVNYVYFLALAVLLMTGIFNPADETVVIKTKDKLIFATIVILFFVATMFICFLLFTSVLDQGIIGNFHGRYFIPLLPIVLSCFNTRLKIKSVWLNLLVTLPLAFISFVCIVKLFAEYYL